MASALRLTGWLLALCATVAVGAPENGDAPIEKQVFPLVKEGDVWWAGVGDVSRIVGATFRGDIGWVRREDGEGRVGIEAWMQIGGNGPYKLKVGEDTYELKPDELAVTRNGEEFGDFVMAPKRIEGRVCATLEDLGRILGFEVGEEVDGQPTIVHEGEQYRLVKGERRWAAPVLGNGDVLVVPPDELRERLETAPFIWRGWQGAPPGLEAGPYTEHNGMTYQRGTWGIQVGPYTARPSINTETLFGPVAPGYFRAEGQSANLMFLSIVRRQVPTGGVVSRDPMRDLQEEAQRRALEEAARKARERQEQEGDR